MFVVRLSPREVEEGGCEVGGGRRETGVIYMTLVDNWRDMTELGQGQRARALGWEGYGLGPTAALAIQLATAPASLPFSATRSPGTPSLFPAHPLPRPPRPRPDPPSPWLATPPRPARPLPPSTRIIVSSTASTARYAPTVSRAVHLCVSSIECACQTLPDSSPAGRASPCFRPAHPCHPFPRARPPRHCASPRSPGRTQPYPRPCAILGRRPACFGQALTRTRTETGCKLYSCRPRNATARTHARHHPPHLVALRRRHTISPATQLEPPYNRAITIPLPPCHWQASCRR